MQELEIQLAARSAECLDLKLQLSKVQELETRLAERSKERSAGCHDLRLQVAQEASVEEEDRGRSNEAYGSCTRLCSPSFTPSP